MAEQYIFTMQGVTKRLKTGKTLFDNIWLSYLPGAKIGVIGHNGSGKSTLLKIMAGLDTDFTGETILAKGAKVGYLAQEPDMDPNKTVREVATEGLGEISQMLQEFEAISLKMAEEITDDEMNALLEKQGDLQEKIDAVDGWDLDRHIDIAMDALRCPEPDQKVGVLSGGEKRRVALCRLLLQKPDMLLLDEPTNHLDALSVAWLERHLRDYAGTVIVVTHDRYFLDNITEWILEIDQGTFRPYHANYKEWLKQKQKILHDQQSQENKLSKALEEELAWVNESPKGRMKKSKARLTAFEKSTANQRETKAYTSQIIIPDGETLGDQVITFEDITKAENDRVLIDAFSAAIPKGAIVGIIGANGAGKTTLFRMITGQATPDTGSIAIGQKVSLGYVDQSRDILNDEDTIWQAISGGAEVLDLGGRDVNSRAYCSWFHFKGADQQKKLRDLSGGERNRVHLARILKARHNVLLLDEPTNDLDIETLRALEEALLDFSGVALIISHDRWFLDRIATHIIAYEGDSNVHFHVGNYASYVDDAKARLGDDLLAPHRLKYKALRRG
jgi:ATP-binding cassette ChvD family protein